MLAIKTVLFITAYQLVGASDSEETILYYYGLEESERSLPLCSAQQACSALVQRYWRRAALVRLCRCGRRERCDERAPPTRLLEINNRAHLQFCQPTTHWPACSYEDEALTVSTPYERLNPDDLEQFHHKSVQLVPPKITAKCKCGDPNYWKLNATINDIKVYQCSSLAYCSTGEFCGNVDYDLSALHQSCLCPKRHICVHNGGIALAQISELLYNGRGWKAYCQRVDNEDSYEEY